MMQEEFMVIRYIIHETRDKTSQSVMQKDGSSDRSVFEETVSNSFMDISREGEDILNNTVIIDKSETATDHQEDDERGKSKLYYVSKAVARSKRCKIF